MDYREQKADDVLLVQIGKHMYSLPVSAVGGIVSLQKSAISAVPFDSGGRIRGIFNSKGVVTALVNCKGLKAGSDVDGSDDLTAVILNNNGKRFAILVDRAKAVVNAAPKDGVIPLNVNKLYSGEENDDD